MAYDFQSLIQYFKSFEPSLEAHLSTELSSATPNHRQSIRRSLVDRLLGLSKDEKSKMDDLDNPPQTAEWSISISHCQKAGGWVAVPRGKRVGLDLEEYDRIQDKLIRRIANPGELDNIPDPAFLWCAKESYFKALADHHQPTAITQINIDSWQKVDSVYFFVGRGSPAGRGLVIRDENLLVSICLVTT